MHLHGTDLLLLGIFEARTRHRLETYFRDPVLERIDCALDLMKLCTDEMNRT